MPKDNEKISSSLEEKYVRIVEERVKKKLADKKEIANVGTRLKTVRKKVFNKIRNNWGKLMIGGIMISTLQMCRMSPQETQEFKKDYTELRAQQNKAKERKCLKGSFWHWNDEYDNYLKEKGFSLPEQPFKQQHWPKGKTSLYIEILDKDSTEVGWAEILVKAGRVLTVDLYAFSDKAGNTDLCNLAKRGDVSVEETSLSIMSGEKIKDALARDSQLSMMKTFHPFLSRECEKNI